MADFFSDFLVVASSRNLSPQAACHALISGSESVGKASWEMSGGKSSPVSRFFRRQFSTAKITYCTCSSGDKRTWMDSQRTNPLRVRAGMVGGSKSFSVGCRVC